MPHPRTPLLRDPLLSTWMEDVRNTFAAFAADVRPGDPDVAALDLIFVEHAGEHLWYSTRKKPPTWGALEVDGFFKWIAGSPWWSAGWQVVALATLCEFYAWQVQTGRMTGDRAAPIVGRLSQLARLVAARTTPDT